MTNKMENKNDVTMEKNYTVYMHVCPNGKRYIGITRRKPEKRWGKDGNGYKYNKHFWNAIQKYDWNNIEHIIIENNLTKEQAENMEIELIAKYRSNESDYGYNIENGGNAIGKISNETKKKISDANKGHKLSNEHKEKLLKANKGHKHSNERKEKISNATKGKNNPKAKKVYCDKMIFGCIKECALYFNIASTTMTGWLQGRHRMPLDFQQLGLRIATKDDLNTYPRYTLENN